MKAVLVLAAAVGLAGCRHEPSPEAVLHRYAQLLREGRIEAAYELTTARYRAHHDVATFAAQVARQPLVEGRVVDREVVLRLDGEDGPIVLAGRDAAHLSFTRDPLDAYPQDTPEACLRSLARAVAHERRDVLKRLLSPPLGTRLRVAWANEPLAQELTDAAGRVSQSLAAQAGVRPPIVQLDGDAHAKLLLGEGTAITLDEQPAGWQISALP